MRPSRLVCPSMLFVLGFGSACGFMGCSSEAPVDPSYVQVELVPASTATQAPRAVRVVITNEATSALVASLCVNIEGMPGMPTASFVLRRDAGKPASDRISIEVTPFDLIAGQETVDPGKEFACPSTLPPASGEARKVSVDFCEAETRKLVFHVGAECCAGSGGAGGSGSCACMAGFVCGVGLTSAGRPCGPSDCCGESISAACALDL
ncbi:MAG TPA: hypothetical protein PK156_18270 [Polyangium sp.]|nr:hypothetical protein [Polyangium sp.]